MKSSHFPHLDEIRASIRELHRVLGRERVSKYPTWHPPVLAAGEAPEYFVSRCVKSIMDHYELIHSTSVVVTFEKMEQPAYVVLEDERVLFAFLNRCYEQDTTDLPAVLAHEITHIFLHRLGVGFPETAANEILTDAACTYLGLGWTSLNAFRVQSRKVDAQTTVVATHRLGYLTPEEFGYVLAKRYHLTGDNPRAMLKRREVRQAYSWGARQARDEQVALNHGRWQRVWYVVRRSVVRARRDLPLRWHAYCFTNDSRVVLRCRTCTQLLRFPTGKRLIGRCPNCRSDHEYAT